MQAGPHDSQLAGPSTIRQRYMPRRPFVSADHRPAEFDGIFRVVLISTGSVASVRIPNIVGELSKDREISLQIVATKAATHFYSEDEVERAYRDNRPSVSASDNGHDEQMTDTIEGLGTIPVWTDEDEWSDWRKLGDPILHIELRRWADLVVVAPCSADMLAKIAGGLCDTLALSLLRALSPQTPVILCPAMNTFMYQHPLTEVHLGIVQDKLGYLISGPQGAGKLACGDEGAGKMTDWREIVDTIRGFALVFREKHNRSSSRLDGESSRTSSGISQLIASNNFGQAKVAGEENPIASANHLPEFNMLGNANPARAPSGRAVARDGPALDSTLDESAIDYAQLPPGLQAQVRLDGRLGGDGTVWQRQWWAAW